MPCGPPPSSCFALARRLRLSYLVFCADFSLPPCFLSIPFLANAACAASISLACARSLWGLRSELCAALLTFRSLRSISFSSRLSPFLQTPLAPLRSLLLALADFRQAPLRALRISSRRTLRFVADFAKTPDLDLAAGYPVRPLSQIAVSSFEARSFRLRQTSASLRTARPVLRPSSLSATACLCFAKIRCPCLQNALFASAAKVRSERSLRRTDISVRLSDRGSCLRPCERF